MAKTSTLHTRIETDLKNSVESIFAQLGLTSADAIKLFYKQVELQGGLPFDLKVPHKVLAEQRLFDEIELGRKSAQEKGYMSVADSKAALGL
ncbi:MAG: type II toxin-antitoxin system RelB/DinJ family antitoxin [Muribaculaceae bacterium]|nr:type II toxin-antitoxin system RelB/DinJ family antitoxin [Muribaculaceae bacterium]